MQSRHDPQGELIVVQAMLHREEDPARSALLRERERVLLRAHESTWLGRLPRNTARYTWRFGFLEELELVTTEGAQTIEALATAPAARFLRTLDLRVVDDELGDLPKSTDPLPAVERYGLPSVLRCLRFSTSVGRRRFDRLYPFVRRLEDLYLDEPGALGVLDLPRLERLTLRGYTAGHVVALARSNLPALTELCLWDGPLAPLADLRLPRSPRVRKLSLSKQPVDANAILREAPLMKQIEVLDWIH